MNPRHVIFRSASGLGGYDRMIPKWQIAFWPAAAFAIGATKGQTWRPDSLRFGTNRLQPPPPKQKARVDMLNMPEKPTLDSDLPGLKERIASLPPLASAT
jgi:hypothetical protein